MSNRIQIVRSNTPGNRPAAASNLQGVLFANFPDRQVTVMDSAKLPVDLLAVRYFSTLAGYNPKDLVVRVGAGIYQANTAVSPGAFNPAQWSLLLDQGALTAALAPYMPLAGGVFSGPVAMGGTVPAGAGPATLITHALTADTVALNAYKDGSGVWHTESAGRAGFLDFNPTSGIVSLYNTNSVAAGATPTPNAALTLDAAGSITVPGSTTTTVNSITRGVTYPSYNSATDFYLNASAASRVLNWATHWYEVWDTSNGSNNWVGWNGSVEFSRMYLDASGNFQTNGQIHALNSAAIFTDGTVQGHQVTSTGNINATGNLSASGVLTVSGNGSVGGAFTGGSLTSSTNLQVNGSGQINSNLNVSGNLTISGTFTIGTITANQLNYNNITSTTFYGHAYAFGWNGNGTRHRVDGGDQGYLTRSDNTYWLHWAGSAMQTNMDGGHTAAWNVFATLREAEDAAADIASIRDLKALVQALTERVQTLEARLS